MRVKYEFALQYMSYCLELVDAHKRPGTIIEYKSQRGVPASFHATSYMHT